MKVMQIVGFLKLSIGASNSEASEQSRIDTEIKELRKLAEGTLTYTESYAVKDDAKDARRASGWLCCGASDRVMSPERWLDHVIFYSLEKRCAEIEDDNLFIGIALYAQRYYSLRTCFDCT